MPLQNVSTSNLTITLRGDIVTRALPPDWTDLDEQALWWSIGRRPGQLVVPRWMLEMYNEEMDKIALDRQDTHNVTCNAGRTNVLTYLTNGITAGTLSSYPGVNVFAVGTGVSPNFKSTDTTLASEFYRQQVGSYTISGNQALFTTNFSTGVGNATYTEAGIFAVSGSLPGAANSGVLFGHASYTYTKTISLTLQNQYTLTLA